MLSLGQGSPQAGQLNAAPQERGTKPGPALQKPLPVGITSLMLGRC
jgi:hypothetical protein